MGGYAAIADTSETLIELLREEFTERSDVIALDRNEIALISPADVGADPDVRLSLYLYSIVENSVLKNAEPRNIDGNTVRDPPLALDLCYLLSAFPVQAGSDETTNTVDQQRVLGLAMQILKDNSVLGPQIHRGSPSMKDLQVAMITDNEEIMGIWHTFQETPYYPSIAYRVSPVMIESTVEHEIARVTERGVEYKRESGGQ